MTEPSDLLLFSTPSMAAIFSPRAHVRGMLAFEAALARAEARVGIVPPADTWAVQIHLSIGPLHPTARCGRREVETERGFHDR